MNRIFLFLSFVFVVALTSIAFSPQDKKSNHDNILANAGDKRNIECNEATKQQITDLYGKLPLTFVENKGQYDSQVLFCARNPQATVYFCQNEVVFHFVEKQPPSKALSQRREAAEKKTYHPLREPSRSLSAVADSWFNFSSSLCNPQSAIPNPQLPASRKELVLRVSFPDANPNVSIEGLDELSGKVNIFKGSDESKWLKDISTYKKIIYHNLWDGIDLVYYGMPEYGMKYDLIVHPNVDPTKARFQYAGQDDLLVNSSGEFVVQTAIGQVNEKKPYIYQEIQGNRIEIEGFFIIEGNNLGWHIKDYDKGNTLIIDPGLIYSTLLGGTSYDTGNGIAIDTFGNAYIAGATDSSDFPTTAGAFDTSFNGDSDVFVTKLMSDGSGLIYSTFVGGTLGDGVQEIAIDASGNAYIAGFTDSSDFPTTAGAFDTSFNGDSDGFVTKLNSTGNGLVYSTFVGGTSNDSGLGIAIDVSGNAYITGKTSSSDFPTTAGSFDTSFDGTSDGFVTKFNSAGSGLIYSTYVGGTSRDSGLGITIDPLGNAYTTGWTKSSDFPTTLGAYDTSFNGHSDGFVTKLMSDGSGLIYSTFLGGSESDNGHGIAIDTAGNAYITGHTESLDFPTTPGAYDTSYYEHNQSSDAFITKLNSDGNGLVYSTFLGGYWDEHGYKIAVDALGNAYITGYIYASLDFPTTADAYDISFNGYYDVFVTELNSAGNRLVYSTYLGGTSGEYGRGIAIDALGNVHITGQTHSSEFPTTAGAYDTSFNGGAYDAFVLKIHHPLRIYLVIHNESETTIFWNALSGKSYIVEWSEDMSSWNSVSVGQVGEWTNTDSSGHSKEFYRVREE